MCSAKIADPYVVRIPAVSKKSLIASRRRPSSTANGPVIQMLSNGE